MRTTFQQIEQAITDRLALCDAARKGPWASRLNHKPYKVVWISEKDNYCTLELEAADADFIAAARTGYPAMLKALLETAKTWEELRINSDIPYTAASALQSILTNLQ